MIGSRGVSTSFDSEPERTFLRLRRDARGKGVVGEEELEEDLDTIMEEGAGEGAGNHAPKERRLLGSYINPNPGSCWSSTSRPTISN